MNRRTAASLMTIGCLTLQACELGPDYPGPNRTLRTETDSYCANTDEEQSQYLVTIESGGALGLNLRGEVGILVERTRSYDTDPLVVVAACPEFEDLAMPHPAARRDPVLSIPLDHALPIDLDCEVSFIAPSDYEGSECMPWHLEAWGDLDGLAVEYGDAFLGLEVSEAWFPARRE